MDKVRQLAYELYNQKILDGWKNVSMNTCINRATDYYSMDEIVKKLTIPVVVGQSEQLFCGVKDRFCPYEVSDRKCIAQHKCINQVAK